MGEEQRRAAHALALAGEGRDVALICSGDAGIYAMAALVYELLDPASGAKIPDAARRVAVDVVPGVSAFQAAAAAAGAMIGHDFCCISLSDLLTPWEVIESRLSAAAEGDFVIALYNPRSRERRDQLERAMAIVSRHRPPATPVVVAANLGRNGEQVTIVSLRDFDCDRGRHAHAGPDRLLAIPTPSCAAMAAPLSTLRAATQPKAILGNDPSSVPNRHGRA